MNIIDRIKKIRADKNWSQKDLATKSGISIGMIGGIENGTRYPSKKSLDKLATALGVSSHYLEYGDIESDSSAINDFLKRLVDNGIITDTKNIEDGTKEIILKMIEAELGLLLKEKNKR